MKASPSSIKRLRKCKRQWAFRYCASLPQEDKAYFEFGKRLHKHSENWLMRGEVPPDDTKEGKLFFEGIPHLPRPGDADCELQVAVWLDEDLEFMGCLVGEGPLPDAPYVFFGFVDVLSRTDPLLADHKTFGNSKWVLTADELADDEAAVIYSAAITEGRALPELLLRWVYYSKAARPKAFPIENVITREESLIKLRTHVPDLVEMARIKALFRDGDDWIAVANTVQNTPSECDSQGRNCDYWQHCRIFEPTKEERQMAETANQRVLELKAKIEAKKKAALANAPEMGAQADEVAKEVSQPPVKEAEPQSAAVPANEPAKEADPIVPEKKRLGRPAKAATGDVPSGVQATVQETLEGLLSSGRRLRIEISLVA